MNIQLAIKETMAEKAARAVSNQIETMQLERAEAERSLSKLRVGAMASAARTRAVSWLMRKQT